MNIVFTENFEVRLKAILDFIALHSVSRAVLFHDELYVKITKIPQMPYSFRKNQLLNNENVRDMIYKGYVVAFKITPESIIILGIYKHNLWNPSDL